MIKTNIEFLMNTILFAKYVLYQDEFTKDELQNDYDIKYAHERFILKNKDWIDDISSIRNKPFSDSIHISTSCIISKNIGYFAYSYKTEKELYDYLVNDLCDQFITQCKMTEKDVEEALQDVENDLFDLYRANLNLANRLILDIVKKYKVKPQLKRPLLIAV
ncbi:hypothetical protein Q6O01_004606 [Salmonella enterica]|nr:hypothetical protein [Salmonella enterica]